MIVLSFVGNKGGITKTSLTINIGAGCALAGLKTVIVDTDSQASATRILGLTPQPGLHGLLIEDKEFADVLVPVPTSFTGQSVDLWALPTDSSQRMVEQHPATAQLIYDRFSELKEWADVVLIDTSPGITEVHAGVYYASDYMILPTMLDFMSLLGLQATLSYLAQAAIEGAAKGFPAANILGIVPNRFASSEKVQQANWGFLRGRYGLQYPIFGVMRNLTVWSQSTQLRTSIYAYAPEDDYSARRAAKIAANELQPVLDAVLKLFPAVAHD